VSPIDIVLARLDKPRPNGERRWRTCCPAHGGTNPSALSIGVGADDQVLLRCWHGCDVEQIVHALGLEVSDLFPPRRDPGAGSGAVKRRRLVTAGQALELINNEMLLTVVCASSLARGEPLDDASRDRLLQGAARVTLLREEVHS
jgi:hypothetical protein